MGNSNYSAELLDAIQKANSKCPNKVFYEFGGYFALTDDCIAYMFDEYGNGPKGGRSIPTFTGLSVEDSEYIKKLLSDYGFEASDFAETVHSSNYPFIVPSGISWADEFAEETFGICDDEEDTGVIETEDDDTINSDSEDAINYCKLKEAVETKQTKYDSMEELLEDIYRFGLSENELYYPWEDGPINLLENLFDSFEDPLDVATEEEWIEVLENIESFVAGPCAVE